MALHGSQIRGETNTKKSWTRIVSTATVRTKYCFVRVRTEAARSKIGISNRAF